MKNALQNSKYCFSYIRFSSEGQRDGSSVERQSPIAERVAAEKGWTLKPEWNAQDLGVSAFKGDNIKTLKAIIEATKSGKIAQGSVMVLEAFDRFSRADLDTAEDILKEMLRAGLEVYVYRGGHHLTKESLNKPIDRIIALLELAAANEYSAKLSERVKKASALKAAKILNGEVIKTKVCPGWINGQTWELNEKANTIAAIFNLYLGGMGATAIARKFNADKVPSLGGNAWAQSVIYRLLSCRQVIGEIEVNGETVKDYYPKAVSEETFMRVQAKLEDNRGKRPTGTNNGGQIVNMFAGVARCACGSLLKVVTAKGEVKYATCYGRLNGLGCKAPMVQYAPFEHAFCNILRLNPSQLLQDENGESQNVQEQILKGRLAETEKQIANIGEALSIAVTKDLVLRQAALEQQAEDIKRQLSLEGAKRVSSTGGRERLVKLCEGLLNVKEDQTVRVQVQSWIREHVNQVTVDRTSKEFSVDLKNGNLILMGLDGTIKGIKSPTPCGLQTALAMVAQA